ncbi:MAG: type II secretion system protein [Candidatus Omnitrophica bacterium]|nr:type II secretion system protein [Candidatus Omnitrophota bacterium]
MFLFHRQRKGFTLIELLTVIAIIGILFTFLTSGIQTARRKAAQAKCASNLRNIVVGCQMYASDHNERFPKSLDDLYPDYVDNLEVFMCPGSGSEAPASASSGDYTYVSGLTTSDPSTTIIAHDNPDNHRGRGGNVAAVGGDVRWQPGSGGSWSPSLD